MPLLHVRGASCKKCISREPNTQETKASQPLSGRRVYKILALLSVAILKEGSEGFFGPGLPQVNQIFPSPPVQRIFRTPWRENPMTHGQKRPLLLAGFFAAGHQRWFSFRRVSYLGARKKSEPRVRYPVGQWAHKLG